MGPVPFSGVECPLVSPDPSKVSFGGRSPTCFCREGPWSGTAVRLENSWCVFGSPTSLPSPVCHSRDVRGRSHFGSGHPWFVGTLLGLPVRATHWCPLPPLCQTSVVSSTLRPSPLTDVAHPLPLLGPRPTPVPLPRLGPGAGPESRRVVSTPADGALVPPETLRFQFPSRPHLRPSPDRCHGVRGTTSASSTPRLLTPLWTGPPSPPLHSSHVVSCPSHRGGRVVLRPSMTLLPPECPSPVLLRDGPRSLLK